MPVGTGGRIAQDQVLISIHEVLSGIDSPVIQSRPSSTMSAPDPAFLLQDWCAEPSEVKDKFLVHDTRGLKWALHDFEPPAGLADGDVSRVLETFVLMGAHPGGRSVEGIGFQHRDLQVVNALQATGLVQPRDGNRWALTMPGVSALVSAWQLDSGTRVFNVRDALPLEERATYEMIQTLFANGWAWQQWYPAGRLPRGAPAIPTGYAEGGPKVFHTPHALC